MSLHYEWRMTNIVFEALAVSPRPKRNKPGNELAINCPACVHQGVGHRPDRRWRGGIGLKGDAVIYHCQNCGYRTGWQPGHVLSYKLTDLMDWCGVSPEIIRDIKFYAAELRYRAKMGGPRVLLPDDLKSCNEWLEAGCQDGRFLEVATFLQSFDPPKDLRDYYWTPDPNGIALDTYVVVLNGTIEYPTSWLAIPLLDMTQPHRSNRGIEMDTDDELTDQEIGKMDRLMLEHPYGNDEEIIP